MFTFPYSSLLVLLTVPQFISSSPNLLATPIYSMLPNTTHARLNEDLHAAMVLLNNSRVFGEVTTSLSLDGVIQLLVCQQPCVRYIGPLLPLPLYHEGKQRPTLVTRAHDMNFGEPRMSFVIFTTFRGASLENVHPVLRGMCMGVAGDVTPEKTELGLVHMEMGWSVYGRTTSAQYLFRLRLRLATHRYSVR